MTKHGLTPTNILRTLPSVLKNDEKMNALATVIASVLAERHDEIDRVKIYAQIDNLPEDLLDTLARNFKVDWYGYNFPLSVKREQFKDSFRVRRHLGTAGAMEIALRNIYPHTEVEEWFEYGGEPYYFRVILDVTNPQVNLSHEDTIRNIMWFKNKRSHLQDGTVFFRSRADIELGLTTGYAVYTVRLCGTYPVRATQGDVVDHDVIIFTDAEGLEYSVPISGEIKAGTHPEVATQGANPKDNIGIDGQGGGVGYRSRLCGSAPGSLI